MLPLPPTESSRTGRTHRLHLLAIGLVGLALALRLLHGGFNEWGGDNVTFVALAESLAGGHGYVDRFGPATLPHTRYPPLFPLMLVPWVAAGAPLIAIKAFVAALSLGGLGLAYLYLARTLRESTAFLACLATVVCGVFLDAGFSVMSDGPYLLLSFAGLLLVDTALRRPDCGKLRWIGAGLLLGLATLTRTAGLTLLPALGATSLLGASTLPLRARLARGVTIGLVAVALIGTWHGRSLLPALLAPDGTGQEDLAEPVSADVGPPEGPAEETAGGAPTGSTDVQAAGESAPVDPAGTPVGYAEEFLKHGEGPPGSISSGGNALLDRPLLNVKDLWSRAWDSVLPELFRAADPLVAWWARCAIMGALLGLGALSAVGLAAGVVLRRRIGDFYGGAYCLMLLFWIGGGPRLLLPILPMLIVWVVEGAGLLASGLWQLRRGRDAARTRRRTELGTLAVILALNLTVTFATPHMTSRLSGSRDRWWGNFLRATDRAAELLPAGSLIITAPAVVPYQRHGLHAMGLTNARSRGVWVNLDRVLATGAEAMILTPFLRFYADNRLHRIYEVFPDRFEVLFEKGDVKLLRIRRDVVGG